MLTVSYEISNKYDTELKIQYLILKMTHDNLENVNKTNKCVDSYDHDEFSLLSSIVPTFIFSKNSDK